MNEASDDVSMAPETMDMGGAPPHTDTLIRPAACGRVQNRTVQKTRRVRVLALSLLCSWTLLLLPPIALPDDPDASSLDTRQRIYCLVIAGRPLNKV